MFRLLGVPEADEQLAILEGEHLPALVALIRETLDGLDQRPGPVRRDPAPG